MPDKISPNVTLYFATIRAEFPKYRVRTYVSSGAAYAIVTKPDRKQAGWAQSTMMIEQASGPVTAEAIWKLKRLLDAEEQHQTPREPWG